MSLLKDPYYQAMLTLRRRQSRVIGFLSYKNGTSVSMGEEVLLRDALIFFETYQRIYVFQVKPSNHLSESVLVFEKKPDQHHLIADGLYREYFPELQAYFDNEPFNINDQILNLILSDLTITSMTEKVSSFFDRLIQRLIDVQMRFDLPFDSAVVIVIQKYQDRQQRDVRIATLLRIADELGIDLSILLSDVDLRPYVNIDSDRHPLSEDYIFAFEQAVRNKLRRAIHRAGLTFEEITRRTGLGVHTVRYATSTRTRWVSKYDSLDKITAVLGKNIKQFLIEVDASVSRRVEREQQPIADQPQPFEFIGNRILGAMSLAGVHSKDDIFNTLMVHRNALGQENHSLKLLLRVSRKTGVPLALLVSEDSLEGHVDPQALQEADVTEEEVEKAKQLIIYYIKRRMVELNLSLMGLASLHDQLKETTLRALLSGRRTPRYFLLENITEALRTTLPDLLKDFETDMERFESLDLNIEIPKPRVQSISESVRDEFQRWVDRMVQAMRLTGIPTYILKNTLHIEVEEFNRRPGLFVRQIFRVAHVAGISEAQLLGHRELSQIIHPHRDRQQIQPISDQNVRRKMRNLRERVEVYRSTSVREDIPWRADIYENPHLPIVQLLQFAEDIQVDALLFFR